MDRDDIKFIPVGDNTAAGAGEVENLFVNNFMFNDVCGNPMHQDMEFLFPSSPTSGGEPSVEFKRLASFMMTVAHMNQRMFTRAFDSLRKVTDARFSKLEGKIENLQSSMSRCLGTTQLTHNLTQGETATDTVTAETHSNYNSAETEANNSPRTDEQPVLQIILEDTDENNTGSSDIGRQQQDEGNSNRSSSNDLQRIRVQANNSARVAKPRMSCKFCGKSCAASYVYIHQRYKCPQRSVQDQQIPLVPSPTVIPVSQNSQAVFRQGDIFYLLDTSSSTGQADVCSSAV